MGTRSVSEILVLEDQETRVRWLRGMAPGAQIVWADNVLRLIHILTHQRAWDLVVLDYDLGREDGHGIDAAKHIRVVGPIIVWTLSLSAGPRMEEILLERGQNVVGHLPFGSPGLRRYIERFV